MRENGDTVRGDSKASKAVFRFGQWLMFAVAVALFFWPTLASMLPSIPEPREGVRLIQLSVLSLMFAVACQWLNGAPAPAMAVWFWLAAGLSAILTLAA